jgi:hypothetical protein
MAGPTIRKDDWVRLQQVINTLWDRTTPQGTNGFVGRDPPGIDLAGTTINGWADNTFIAVDLSGIIPKGTKAVLLRVACTAATVGVSISAKAHGVTGTYCPTITTQAISAVNRAELVVPTNGLQSLDMKHQGTIDPAQCNMAVLGWWT